MGVRPKQKGNAMKNDKPIRQRAIRAVATFVALIHANEKGDVQRTQAAQAELKRLGVRVGFAKAVTK